MLRTRLSAMQKGNLGTRGFYKLHRMSPNEILQNKSSKSKKEVFYKMEILQNVCKHLLKNYLDKKTEQIEKCLVKS